MAAKTPVLTPPETNKEMSMQSTLLKALLAAAVAAALMPAQAAQEKVNTTMCVACHSQVGDFHKSGSHKNVSCTSCHTGLASHLKAPGKDTRPQTSLAPATCGGCHQDQYQSMYKANPDRMARVPKKNAEGVAPDPFFDRALGGHGFTKEHSELRSHNFMVLDQFLCDRAFGGRFEPKDGWLYLTMGSGDFDAWSVMKDIAPDNNAQKPQRIGTAAAANPVCISCKSTDLMLDWAYMGDKNDKATFSRQSNVVDMARKTSHSLNCNFCHDPHSAKPRIVRDALIQALTRTDYPTVYSEDPNRTKIDVKDVGVRGFDRKIAFLEKADAKLMCAQCHVEYNCNPGIDTATGKPVKMDDQRTNVFPFVAADKIDDFYKHINFKDFKHAETGALLTKMQHPDVETFWTSKHAKAGADCATCHMPKVKGKNGKTYTLHWATSPKHYMKETCLTCHKDKTAEQMTKTVDAMKAYYNGKIREAESRMTDMFNAFDIALAMGVDEATLNKARELHSVAHTNWEYWTAVNGAWFHNPEMARDSLAKSAAAAQEATKLLRDAVQKKNAK